MNKTKLDIIDKILDACYQHNPNALFIMSLMHQYEERGSLSKKQLQGLHQKALKVKDMPANWLATLEATILKMPTRYKTPAQAGKPLFQKNENINNIIAAILLKYPQHKQVLLLQTKINKNEQLTTNELNDLKRFEKLLLK